MRFSCLYPRQCGSIWPEASYHDQAKLMPAMNALNEPRPAEPALGFIIPDRLVRPLILMSLALATVGPMASLARAQNAPAPEEAEKESTWERSAALGLTLTKGNSDTLLFSANVDAMKKWEQNELNLGASGTYGEREDEKDNEAARGFIQYNRLFTERWFGYARAELFHDDIANVVYRLSLSPGIGYYFIKEEMTTLRGEIGPGYVYEELDTDGDNDGPGDVDGDGDDDGESNGYFTLRLADRFEHKLNERARIWQTAELLPQVDDFGNFLLNAEVGVETQLTDSLNIRVLVQDTYDNEPAEGRKKNDLKLITSLVYRF